MIGKIKFKISSFCNRNIELLVGAFMMSLLTVLTVIAGALVALCFLGIRIDEHLVLWLKGTFIL